jgi:serine/threonine protein kinase
LDLKLENILLTDDYRIKLCDFGFSQSVHNRIFKSVGTDGYKAPEIYKISNHHPNQFFEINVEDDGCLNEEVS